MLCDQSAFRARQVASWIYRKGITHFAEMTNLSKELRRNLAQAHSLERLPVAAARVSADGAARKFLFSLPGDLSIEAVLIREPRWDTICVSTQAGCAFGCRFCATAQMGLQRNLTAHEILSQILVIRDELKGLGSEGYFNLVFMGMGEPLANYAAVVHSIRILNDDFGLGIGRRRITVSTVGLVPQIHRLAREKIAVRLALSLNATTNETRSGLMPVNRRFPIEDALAALDDYREQTGNRTTLEYVLIDRLNDSLDDARRLARFARQTQSKINLILFNPHPGTDLRPSPPKQVHAFRDVMLPIAPTVTVRESKGQDILAACGQLSTTHRSP